MIIGCLFCGGVLEIWLIGMGISCLVCWLRKIFKKHKEGCGCGCHVKADEIEQREKGEKEDAAR